MNENGTLTVVDKERANILNNYFASVFTKEKDENLPHFEERYITHPLDELEITSETVEKSLSSMKAGKSQGPDMIHPRILKETSSQIIEPLTKLFRQSLDEAKLPEDWKKANVTALFKSGERKLPENYRPISLTSVVCKLMERIIRNKIVDHMESNNLFAKQQHGFRAGRSCTTQLLEFMEEVTEAIDRGEEVDVIYLDFAKAFDKVPHKRLLSKLKGYGIKGKIYDWIKDFLSNRKQRVVINGKFSHWIRVTSGIPQGSVLGPILFLIFINDLPDVLNCCMKLFADDAKLYMPIINCHDEEILQQNLDNSDKWAEIWDMDFNTKKCKHMRLGAKTPLQQYTMKSGVERVNLEQVTSEKDLGVTVDNKLLFREHISKKSAIANRNLGIIFKSFTYLDKEMFLCLYKSLVRPHFEYATTVWSPMYKKDAVVLENIQRRATRMVNCLKHLPYNERLKKLGIPSLEYRRLRADVIEVYKIVNQIDRIPTDKFFTINDEISTRSNGLKLFKKWSRLNVRANVFSNRVVNAWNLLPCEIVLAPSLNTFKSRLNKFWYGHPLKFTPSCYTPGETNISVTRRYRNGPLEVV